MGLLHVKSVVGIEMDAFEIRAAEVGGTAVKPSLLGLARTYLPEGVVKDGKVVKPEVLKDILEKLWIESKFKSKNVVLGIGNQDVLLRFAQIPAGPADKMDNIIRFQAQDFLPVPVSEVELDYMILDEMQGGSSNMLKVMLVAGRRNMLGGFLQGVNDAGLKLMDIDVSILALARLPDGQVKEKSVAVIHYTRDQIGMVILDHGRPALARILSVNSSDFHEQENNYGYPAGAEAAATSEQERNINGADQLSDRIVEEIGSSISYYLSQNPGSSVENCMINTAGDSEKNVRSKLAERLDMKVESIDPVKNMNSYRLTGNSSIRSVSDFSVSVSLALRGLEE